MIFIFRPVFYASARLNKLTKVYFNNTIQICFFKLNMLFIYFDPFILDLYRLFTPAAAHVIIYRF